MPEEAELCAGCSTREEAAAPTEAQRLARVSRLLGSAVVPSGARTRGALEGNAGGVPGETSLAVNTLRVIETLVPVGRMDREVLLRLCALGFVELDAILRNLAGAGLVNASPYLPAPAGGVGFGVSVALTARGREAARAVRGAAPAPRERPWRESEGVTS